MPDTNNSPCNSTGHFVEGVLNSFFPELEKNHGVVNAPDFKGDGFWLEAKSGFKYNGPRVHAFQGEFENIPEPVIYAFAYHNVGDVGGLLRRCKTDGGRERALVRTMRVELVYFVSSEVVQRIWNKDRITSKKDKLDYLVVGPSILRNIVLQRNMRRGKGVDTREWQPDVYYGYNSANFLAMHEREVDNLPFKCGFFVDKTHVSALDFLTKYKIKG